MDAAKHNAAHAGRLWPVRRPQKSPVKTGLFQRSRNLAADVASERNIVVSEVVHRRRLLRLLLRTLLAVAAALTTLAALAPLAAKRTSCSALSPGPAGTPCSDEKEGGFRIAQGKA